MKAEETRSQPRKHVLDHELPTVIHDPEADMSALAKWLHHAMENPMQFWGGVAALVAVVVLLSVLTNGVAMRTQGGNEAWARLDSAKTPAERVEIAKDFPNTPAERWALLQAASEFYDKGFQDLPSNRDAALPSLKKALDLYEQVAAAASKDSIQARVAALGVGKTLEARNDLDKAIKQYEKVAQTSEWAGTEEAKTAEKLAKALKTPEVVAFYEKLHKYEAPKATLPADGIGNIDLPITPVPADAPAASAKPADSTPLVLPPLPPEATKPAEPAKPGPVKPEAETKPADGLPKDVFSPAEKPAEPK